VGGTYLQTHDGDLEAVLSRAWAAGVDKIMVTAGQLSEVKEALELLQRYDPKGQRLFTTVGASHAYGRSAGRTLVVRRLRVGPPSAS
jgi:Tat protein secretion system quality control protein TatD with DNase activity